jgi:hypothetical protein
LALAPTSKPRVVVSTTVDQQCNRY